MTDRFLALITDQPIDRAAAEAFVTTRADGALVVFEGVVCDHDHGASVHALDYEAHPDAPAALLASARRIADRWPDVRIAAVHRVGDLVVGDLALACAVASAHRAAAFEACAALVDDIKASVPIWKEQSFVDGSSEWVASLG